VPRGGGEGGPDTTWCEGGRGSDRPAAGPGQSGAGSSNAGAGERHNRGGAVWGNSRWAGLGKKKKMGPAQGNNVTF
jgi:hypothetical protein